MKIEIDGELCTGHGRCWSVASEVYEADERGFNAAAGGTVDVPKDREKAAIQGLQSCPEGAITIVEDFAPRLTASPTSWRSPGH